MHYSWVPYKRLPRFLSFEKRSQSPLLLLGPPAHGDARRWMFWVFCKQNFVTVSSKYEYVSFDTISFPFHK